MDSSLILSVRNLKTHFKLDEGILKAVDGVDFDVQRRKTIGIIGEIGLREERDRLFDHAYRAAARKSGGRHHGIPACQP